MLKKLCTALAIGSFAIGATASVAAAGPPAGVGGGKPAGIACQQAGISTLQSLGLLSTVAANGIEVVGLGVVPFKDVLAFHRTQPALFKTGGVSVIVPGVEDPVPATWCD
ncbi:MAG: hypothetical protein ACSLFP_03250 [Acidimicrobiales bacterium]